MVGSRVVTVIELAVMFASTTRFPSILPFVSICSVSPLNSLTTTTLPRTSKSESISVFPTPFGEIIRLEFVVSVEIVLPINFKLLVSSPSPNSLYSSLKFSFTLIKAARSVSPVPSS